MEDLAVYEGLVGKTAQMYAGMVGWEYEDLRQELYVKVIKAQRKYDAARSKMPERRYVFMCLTNFVKDLKASAAVRARIPIHHIEDYRKSNQENPLPHGDDWFDARYLSTEMDLERFPMPSTITEQEAELILLLILGFQQIEAATMLGLTKTVVSAMLKTIQLKFSDWKPVNGTTIPLVPPCPARPAPPTPAQLPVAPVAAAA